MKNNRLQTKRLCNFNRLYNWYKNAFVSFELTY